MCARLCRCMYVWECMPLQAVGEVKGQLRVFFDDVSKIELRFLGFTAGAFTHLPD